MRSALLEIALVGVGALCLAAFAVFLWLSSPEEPILPSSAPETVSPRPAQSTEISSAVAKESHQISDPEPLEQTSQKLDPDRDRMSFRLTAPVRAEEPAFSGRVEQPLVAIPIETSPESTTDAVELNVISPRLATNASQDRFSLPFSSGKEVIENSSPGNSDELSFHSSGKEIIGAGSTNAGAGSGGILKTTFANGSAEDGAYQALPFVPVDGSSAPSLAEDTNQISFHSSGKEVIGSGNDFGGGSGAGEAGSGGIFDNAVADGASEEGKRRALPYVPVNGEPISGTVSQSTAGSGISGGSASGAGFSSGAPGVSSQSAGATGTGQTGSARATPIGSSIGSNPSGIGSTGGPISTSGSGAGSPLSPGNPSVQVGPPRQVRPIAPALFPPTAVGGSIAGSAAIGGSTGSGVSTASSSGGTAGNGIAPGLTPSSPPAIPPGTGSGIGGGLPVIGGAAAPPPTAAGTPPLLPPVPPVVLPTGPPVSGGGGTPSVSGGVPAPTPGAGGPPPITPGAPVPPVAPVSYAPPNTPSGSPTYSATPGVPPGSPGTGGGGPGLNPPLPPIAPAAVGGAGAGAGSPAGGTPPPAGVTPPVGNTWPDSIEENESEKNLPTQCIPWIVQSGQTIESLAASSGTTPDVILRINKVATIQPGQVIRIPFNAIIPCCE